MPEESRTYRLAILIDADNASPRIAAGLFEEIAKFGEASVRRIYGDFSGQRLKSWADILRLVSSDSDFTRLASRLREQGADVYGFGERKTPESFRRACRRFIYTENLSPDAQDPASGEAPSQKPFQPLSAAIPILKKAVGQVEAEDGWVSLSAVGQQLANAVSDFDSRTYGHRKLSELARGTGAFDVVHLDG